ncbi:unnamed protein product [Schistosoma mattheei]|uniref:Uncharacterized protein n=2 Tax=Schistosoma mattheei TaxID=31246 RepID=A0AA85BHA7_9TREM|nr:unnamed protein product [Schistosoma mattheei]
MRRCYSLMIIKNINIMYIVTFDKEDTFSITIYTTNNYILLTHFIIMFTYIKLLLFYLIFLLCKPNIKCYYTNFKTIDWSNPLTLSEAILAGQAAIEEVDSNSPLSSSSLSTLSRRKFIPSNIDYYPTWSESYLYLKPQRNIDEELRQLKAEPPRGLPNVMRYG